MAELLITTSLVDHVRAFLGTDGLAFFAECKRDHDTYSPVLFYFVRGSRGLPHPVHFREGMQVRNSMRDHADCASWTAHDFDNYWQRVVELCLAPTLPPMPITINTGADDR